MPKMNSGASELAPLLDDRTAAESKIIQWHSQQKSDPAKDQLTRDIRLI